MKSVKSKSKKKTWREKAARRNARGEDRRKNDSVLSLRHSRKYRVFDDKTGMNVIFGSCDFDFKLSKNNIVSHDGWVVSSFLKRKGSCGAFRPVRVE